MGGSGGGGERGGKGDCVATHVREQNMTYLRYLLYVFLVVCRRLRESPIHQTTTNHHETSAGDGDGNGDGGTSHHTLPTVSSTEYGATCTFFHPERKLLLCRFCPFVCHAGHLVSVVRVVALLGRVLLSCRHTASARMSYQCMHLFVVRLVPLSHGVLLLSMLALGQSLLSALVLSVSYDNDDDGYDDDGDDDDGDDADNDGDDADDDGDDADNDGDDADEDCDDADDDGYDDDGNDNVDHGNDDHDDDNQRGWRPQQQSTMMAMDMTTVATIPYSDLKGRTVQRLFEKQLHRWKSGTPRRSKRRVFFVVVAAASLRAKSTSITETEHASCTHQRACKSNAFSFRSDNQRQ